MIACVIASFLVSWTPNHCLTFSIYLMGKSNMPEWMFYWNSVTQVMVIYDHRLGMVVVLKVAQFRLLGFQDSNPK